MLKFSANLGMMFGEEEDPIKRMELAKTSGFGAVEYLFVYDMSLEILKSESSRLGLGWSVVNIALGEGIKNGPLVAATPGKEESWKENVAAAIQYCDVLRPATAVIPAFSPPESVSRDDAMEVFKPSLIYAAEEFHKIGIKLSIEPLNPKIRANALLTTSAETLDLIEELGHSNLGIEFDVFHLYATEGNIDANIKKCLPNVGNIQIADIPDRNEPGTGEVDFESFFKVLEDCNYQNWVAAEYIPSSNTLASLNWMKNYLSN